MEDAIADPTQPAIDAGGGSVRVVVEMGSLASDCTSILSDPANDREAFANGFGSATPLNVDETTGCSRLGRFSERIDY